MNKYEHMKLLEDVMIHLRRIQMVYIKCHDNCMCNGCCRGNPDMLRAEELINNLREAIKDIDKNI